MNSTNVKAAFRASLPVMAGYVFLGAGFGILMQQHGYGLVWSVAMSVFIYAGSMQYVGIELLASGAGLLTAALTTLMVNARHLFYGLSMVESYKNAGKKKNYLIFSLTDETYSLVSCPSVPEGMDKNEYCFLVSAMNQSYWVLGTAIGALIGQMNIDFTGIDFALTALFLTIFLEQWLSTKRHLPALTGLGAATVCLMLFGTDNFLIPTMLLITGILLLTKNTQEEGTEND